MTITAIFEESRGTYGSPRVTAALRQRGVVCNRKRVARLMRQHGLVARHRRHRRVSTTDSRHRLPIAPNHLNRQFWAERPNQKWVVDITYITTAEGWLYLALVLDVFSRKIVGWAMDAHQENRSSSRRCAWRCPSGSPSWATCCIIPTGVISMPASVISNCWPLIASLCR